MTINVVQSVHGTGTSVSFTSNTTAGNTVFCGFVDVGGATATSACKLGGVAGNFAKAIEKDGNSCVASLWYDAGCAGGQKAVAITATGSTTTPAIWAVEVSGLGTSGILDVSSSGTGTATSWSSGATATTAQPSEIAIGVVGNGSTSTTGPSSGWTNLRQSNTFAYFLGYEILTATGTVTYSGSHGSEGWSVVVATFKAAPPVIPAPLMPVPAWPVQRSYLW